MIINPDKYCGDIEMSRLLEKTGAIYSLPQVYGLFYGCLAAPELVMPSSYHALIFGDDGAVFESEKDAMVVMGSLMALWNMLSEWDPEGEDFFFPDIIYKDNDEGVVDRLNDNCDFIESFVKGLELGDVQVNDFTDDALEAMKYLVENISLMQSYAEVIEREGNKGRRTPKEELENAEHLEDIMVECIARINIGLKDARMKIRDEIGLASDDRHVTSQKIQRNALCPCGSGRKYKKCCGLVH